MDDKNKYRQEILDVLRGGEERERRYFGSRAGQEIKALEAEGFILAEQKAGNAPKMIRMSTSPPSFVVLELDLKIQAALIAPQPVVSVGELPVLVEERLRALQAFGFVRYDGGVWSWCGQPVALETLAPAPEERGGAVKTCPKCERVSAYTEVEADVLFGRHTGTRSDGSKKVGWQSWCRACRKAGGDRSYAAKKAQMDMLKPKRGAK